MNLYIRKDFKSSGIGSLYVLANVFMGFYESEWLNEYNLNKLEFYLRNVDDSRLKNVVIFLQTILSFVLSRKIINIYNDIA